MTDIRLHGRSISTVFELLGDKENDITFSVGWALAQSEQFQRRVFAKIFPQLPSSVADVIRLQEHASRTGYTDIEIETGTAHAIIEAKRGWNMPTETQLNKYARRFKDMHRSNAIVVISECSAEFVTHSHFYESVRNIPLHHLSWRDVFAIAGQARQHGTHAERHLLQDLQQYLQRIMSMQDQESNLVYVVALSEEIAEGSSLTWIEFVTKRKHYFHPFGSGGGWPTTPPNYLGFRYGGRLQRIHHVEKYEIVYDLSKYIPEVNASKWKQAHGEYPMVLYWLGPAIVPYRDVKTGNIFSAGRLWAAFDLLLTSSTVADACTKTKQRLKKLHVSA